MDALAAFTHPVDPAAPVEVTLAGRNGDPTRGRVAVRNKHLPKVSVEIRKLDIKKPSLEPRTTERINQRLRNDRPLRSGGFKRLTRQDRMAHDRKQPERLDAACYREVWPTMKPFSRLTRLDYSDRHFFLQKKDAGTGG